MRVSGVGVGAGLCARGAAIGREGHSGRRAGAWSPTVSVSIVQGPSKPRVSPTIAN
jgi:hypothetical protein